MIISVEEKASDEIKHLLIIKKTLSKLVIKRNFLNLIKNIYKNPTANNILNSGKVDASFS